LKPTYEDYPRAYGLQQCRGCKEYFTANSHYFPEIAVRDGAGNLAWERELPLCFRCIPKKKEE